MPTKVFAGGPDLIQGSPHTIYAGHDCPAVGMNDSEAIARARRKFDYARPALIDQHITDLIVADGTSVPTDDLADVVMKFEELAAQEYGGYATILLTKPIAVCAYAQRLIDFSPDGGLMTINGTKVGNIHPVTNAGGSNAFLVGRIVLLEGPIQDRIASQVVLPDGTCHPRRALAEQVIVPLIECLMYHSVATCTLSTP